MTQLPPTVSGLGAGLVLRAVSGPDDVERVAAFDALLHGAGTEPTWRAWMAEHPHADPGGWLFVEEQATRRVVATLCLLHWNIRLCGVELRAAEMGVVGTLEEYRGRGLQRVLNTHFDALLRAGGFDISHIQGIPFFYRQFGYEYAVPLEAWWRLELHMLPAQRVSPGVAVRPATVVDLPALTRLYGETIGSLDLAALRDEATWRFLLGPALATETAADTWVLHRNGEEAAGYFRIARHGFGEGLIVAEASLLRDDTALAVLHAIVDLAHKRGKPYVRLNLPEHHPLVTAAHGLGAHDGHAYAWQVRLPDPVALIRKLAPVFDRRVANSDFAGLARDLVIDLYRQQIVLRFEDGHLIEVEPAAATMPAHLRLPPALLAPLLLGYRTLDQMQPMYPDAAALSPERPLISTLFPPLRGWLYQQY